MSFDSDDDMMENLAPTNLEFWSLEIPSGKTVQASVKDMPGMVELVHITGCALGEDPAKGPHVVKVVPYGLDGKPQREVALGTLVSGRTDQFSVDFGISSTTAFRHSGKSTVYLTGYRTRSFASEYGSDDDEFESEDEDEEEDEDEDDDEEAPQAVALEANGLQAVQKGASTPDADSEEDEGDSSDDDEGEDEDEDESDEDEDEDEDEDKQGDMFDERLGAKSFEAAAARGGSSDEDESDDDESSDDEGEDDSESDNPLDIDTDDEVAGVQYEDGAGATAMDEDLEDDDLEDEDEDDEDEDEDEDESEEESEDEQPAATAAATAAAAAGKAGKRPAQPLTPQPQQVKKQKGAIPQSAPAKPPQARTATGGSEQRFLQALVAELRGGSRTLNELSNKVKKPAEIEGKYKQFLTKHASTFDVDGDKVSLKA